MNMKKKEKKLYLQKKKRYLKKIVGTIDKPRLSIFRSHSHIYAQLIDDTRACTLTSCSTLEKKNLTAEISSSTKLAAFEIGKIVARRALSKDIKVIVFDRGNKPYHGRIQSVAEGAREGGLIF
jgi:large subunit ribosomal protein L18